MAALWSLVDDVLTDGPDILSVLLAVVLLIALGAAAIAAICIPLVLLGWLRG